MEPHNVKREKIILILYGCVIIVFSRADPKSLFALRSKPFLTPHFLESRFLLLRTI